MDLDLITNNSKINSNMNLFNSAKISWIVLGYISNNTINVIETGDNNFDDMFEEFDANKIMYGFLSVIDQNSKLKKNVFIFWQGNAATQSMKSVSVKHAIIISNLCKPVHVTINARDEQDLDMDEIMKKVASSSGSNYSCHPETKKVYEHQASVKSEGNTGANMRQQRLMELSSLGSFHREPEPETRIGSRYEKIDPMKEMKKLRDSVSESTPPYEPVTNYSKVDAVKEIKIALQSPNREEIPRDKIGSRYEKIDPMKEMKKLRDSVTEPIPRYGSMTNYDKVDSGKEIKAPIQSPIRTEVPREIIGYNHRRINPEEELRSINMKQKTLFENKVVVKGENNTAEKAKEEREKELSNLFNKKISYEDTIDSNVGTNYTKINPLEEIKKLRRESITTENEDVFSMNPSTTYKKVNPRDEIMKLRSESITSDDDLSSPSSTYKKIDPMAEIQRLRKSSSIESDENYSLETQYKKVNPAEEIKRLRSCNSIKDEGQTKSSFEKINAMEEINIERRISIEKNSYSSPNADSNNNVTSPARSGVTLSARKSFEMAHKGKHDTNQTQRNRFSKQGSIEERDESVNKASTNKGYNVNSNNTNNNISNFGKLSSGGTSDRQSVNDVPRHSEMTITTINENPKEKTARALFTYDPNDIDEIAFEENEIIRNIETIDEGWWVGTNNAGRRGMFPSNYVELIDGETEETVMSKESNNRSFTIPKESVCVRALFDFTASDHQEVTFNKGDIISDVTMPDDSWWEGTVSNGERGMFPANYVERV